MIVVLLAEAAADAAFPASTAMDARIHDIQGVLLGGSFVSGLMMLGMGLVRLRTAAESSLPDPVGDAASPEEDRIMRKRAKPDQGMTAPDPRRARRSNAGTPLSSYLPGLWRVAFGAAMIAVPSLL